MDNRRKRSNPRRNVTGSTNQPEANGGNDDQERPGFDVKKARFEVLKFAMNSLSGTAKHDAETNLAISLGAKPPKNKYVNYKHLQETRKKEKEDRQLQRFNYSRPKTEVVSKYGNKRKLPNAIMQRSKNSRHSLETTGIYKMKSIPTQRSGHSSGLSKFKKFKKTKPRS